MDLAKARDRAERAQEALRRAEARELERRVAALPPDMEALGRVADKLQMLIEMDHHITDGAAQNRWAAVRSDLEQAVSDLRGFGPSTLRGDSDGWSRLEAVGQFENA